MEASKKDNESAIVSSGERSLGVGRREMPAMIADAGKPARFAYEEFFYGKLRNPHTRRAYQFAVNRFLTWCDERGIELANVTPALVGEYIDQNRASVSTKKQHLAALRHFFDGMVNRHAVVLNPVATVRGERLQVVEGRTPEITVKEARKLLKSIDVRHVVGLRDRAILATLVYTAARVGAIAKLRLHDLYHAGNQWMLHFDEKGSKSREIPVRHDLQRFLFEYLDAAAIRDDDKESSLFRTAVRRERRLTGRGMTANDIGRMVKRRMADAGLSSRLSPHSFRVTTITDLLEQGVPLEDVQYLAGHSDPRTTRLYDRRQKKVTRNIVERISI